MTTKPQPAEQPIKPDHRVTWLFGDGEKSKRAIDLTPMQAIRAKCVDCSGGSLNEVKRCVVHHCPLFPFRFGKRPEFEGVVRKPRKPMTAEHLARLKAGRARKRQEINSEADNVLSHNGSASLDRSGDSNHTQPVASDSKSE